MDTDTKQVIIHKMPVWLWQQLKIVAATEGKTLQVAATEAIERYVKTA